MWAYVQSYRHRHKDSHKHWNSDSKESIVTSCSSSSGIMRWRRDESSRGSPQVLPTGKTARIRVPYKPAHTPETKKQTTTSIATESRFCAIFPMSSVFLNLVPPPFPFPPYSPHVMAYDLSIYVRVWSVSHPRTDWLIKVFNCQGHSDFCLANHI